MAKWQQGDVIIRKVSSIQKNGWKERQDKRVAEGEVTGHAHVVQGPDAYVFEDAKGNRFVESKSDWTLVHEEHNAITMPPGTFEISIVREYNPFQKAIERVKD